MDLKVATMKDIEDELDRRKMLERNKSILDHFTHITVAYNSGKIDRITQTRKKAYDQSGEETTELVYIVYMKSEKEMTR